MTDRLYYNDSYLTSFRASVTEAREKGQLLYLDRTLFYPTSGGQPHDLGTINGVTYHLHDPNVQSVVVGVNYLFH